MKQCYLIVSLLCLPLTVMAVFEERSTLYEGSYSENYVNRWGFQKLCDHVYDLHTNPYAWPTSEKGVRFKPSKVKRGDIIFVRQVPKFMKKVHPHIKVPYIMVTAGERRDQVTKKHLNYLEDDKIIAWFAVHHDCYNTHPKFYQLPLGIYQDKKFYLPRKKLTQTFATWRSAPKEKLLYSNYGDLKGMKPERAGLDDFFKDKDYCFKVKKRMPFLSYMKQMSEFKFALSPRGYGPDCYRTWEALLVGCIPIVRTSPLDSLYADLPVLLVDDWTCLTQEFLEEKYEEMTAKKWSIEKLFVGYWAQLIQSVREEFLRVGK